MKQVFVIPAIVILSALLGYAALRGFGWRPWTHELILAGVPALIAAMAALVPALLHRADGQAAVVQGAFHGMLIHMGVILALSVLAFLAAGPSGLAMKPFAFWAMWFFFVTLVSVSAMLIRLIRATPIGANDMKASSN
jgi:hypothetical protein